MTVRILLTMYEEALVFTKSEVQSFIEWTSSSETLWYIQVIVTTGCLLFCGTNPSKLFALLSRLFMTIIGCSFQIDVSYHVYSELMSDDVAGFTAAFFAS